jgi:hypothetical protein
VLCGGVFLAELVVVAAEVIFEDLVARQGQRN